MNKWITRFFTLLGLLTGLCILYFIITKSGYTVESWFYLVLNDVIHGNWKDWLIYVVFFFITLYIPTLIGFAIGCGTDDFYGFFTGLIGIPISSVLIVAASMILFAFIFGIIVNWDIFGPLTFVFVVTSFASIIYGVRAIIIIIFTRYR